MTPNRTNVVLAMLLAVSVLATFASRVDYSQPNLEILPDMKYTPAWTAYQRNPHFADGQTLQSPVPGSIPRGQMPLHFAPTKEDALRAGSELKNPLAGADRTDAKLLDPARRRSLSRFLYLLPRGQRRRRWAGRQTRISSPAVSDHWELVENEGWSAISHPVVRSRKHVRIRRANLSRPTLGHRELRQKLAPIPRR